MDKIITRNSEVDPASPSVRAMHCAVLKSGLKPYLNTYFFLAIDFAGNLAKFGATWHYASENRIFALYIDVCAAFATRFD